MATADAGRQKGAGKAKSAGQAKKGKASKKGGADSSHPASDNEDIDVDIDDTGVYTVLVVLRLHRLDATVARRTIPACLLVILTWQCWHPWSTAAVASGPLPLPDQFRVKPSTLKHDGLRDSLQPLFCSTVLPQE